MASKFSTIVEYERKSVSPEICGPFGESDTSVPSPNISTFSSTMPVPSSTSSSPSKLLPVADLKCHLCPSHPTFTNTSHLVTHLGSKPHLRERFEIELLANECKEEAARKILDTYIAWYQKEKVGEHLVERYVIRQAAKTKKKLAAINSQDVVKTEQHGDGKHLRGAVIPQGQSAQSRDNVPTQKSSGSNYGQDAHQHTHKQKTDSRPDRIVKPRESKIKRKIENSDTLHPNTKTAHIGAQPSVNALFRRIKKTREPSRSPVARSSLPTPPGSVKSGGSPVLSTATEDVEALGDDVFFQSGSRDPKLRGKIWPGMQVFNYSFGRRQTGSTNTHAIHPDQGMLREMEGHDSTGGLITLGIDSFDQKHKVDMRKRRKLDEEPSTYSVGRDAIQDDGRKFEPDLPQDEGESIFEDESDLDADGEDDDMISIGISDNKHVTFKPTVGQFSTNHLLEDRTSHRILSRIEPETRKATVMESAPAASRNENAASELFGHDPNLDRGLFHRHPPNRGIHQWSSFLRMENFPFQEMSNEDHFGERTYILDGFKGKTQDFKQRLDGEFDNGNAIEQDFDVIEEHEVVHEGVSMGINTLNQSYSNTILASSPDCREFGRW